MRFADRFLAPVRRLHLPGQPLDAAPGTMVSQSDLVVEAQPVRRLRLFGLPLAWTVDAGEARNGKLLFHTDLNAVHRRSDGTILKARRLGSGVIVIGLVNTLVSDAVTGTSVVPTLGRYKYMDTGTGSTPATDGDTALQTPSGVARIVSTLTNAQSATTGNHTAKLQYQGTVSYTGSLAITEFGLFDASSTGNLMDHRVFSAFNVGNGDSIQFTYTLSLPSNN